MPGLRHTAIRAALELLWASQATRLVRRFSTAKGVIFALHRVVPEAPADFAPNAALQIRPDFLAFTIERVRRLGLEVVDLDEAIRRTGSDKKERPFAVFSLETCYRDSLRHALPVFRRLQCPFTLYVPTALVDGVGEVWWFALEQIISHQNALAVTYLGETDYLPTTTAEEKRAAYEDLHLRLRQMPEADRRNLISELAAQYGVDLHRHCRDLIMDWAELRLIASADLCTIGAQTVHHYELAKLPASEARSEIEQSVRIIEAECGIVPRHLSYPFGDQAAAGEREFALARDLGLRSAVTACPGGIHPRHRDRLYALPRVRLDGLLQARRYVDVFATPDVFRWIAG